MRARDSLCSFITGPVLVAGALVGIDAHAAPPPPPPDPSGAPVSERRAAPPPPAAAADTGAEEGRRPDPVIDQRTPTTDLERTWGYASSDAPRPNYVRAERESTFSINPIGYYQGVTIDGSNPPPYDVLAPKTVSGGAPEGLSSTRSLPTPVGSVLTWIGFERKGSSSRVFLQVSSVVPYALDREGGIVSLRLPKTSISVRNNARRLDTRYFKGPVSDVKIRRDNTDVLVTLTLRREAMPNVTVQEGRAGYKLIVIEFADSADDEPLRSDY